MRFLSRPRLPENNVTTVLMAGGFPEIQDALANIGVEVILTQPSKRLAKPIMYHPDMQLCDFGNGHMFVLKGNREYLNGRLYNARFYETKHYPNSVYPYDVLCNCLIVGDYLLGKLSAIDPSIIKYAEQNGKTCINVNQGYTACSSCLITEAAFITEDHTIAKAARTVGIDVLLIKSNAISLPGYDTGFIGGCAGKLAKDKIAFTGALHRHPSNKEIKEFLAYYGVSYIELMKEQPLLDIGGILPVLEMT